MATVVHQHQHTWGRYMARKPNYRFERIQRERDKAAKKAAKLEAKAARKAAIAAGLDPDLEESVGATDQPTGEESES